MKKNMFFVLIASIATVITLESCEKNKAPESITGEVRGLQMKILSDSVTVTLLSVDAEADGKTRSTVTITIDPKNPVNKKILNQIKSMAENEYYQPVFARFKKLGNYDYVCTEIAVMSYDVAGTPPVYIFQSDNHIVSN